MTPYTTTKDPSLKLRFQDTESKTHYFLWYCDIVKLLLDEKKERLLVEHGTGKVFIEGRNLEALALAIHDERVSEIKISGPLLPVVAAAQDSLKIDSLSWEETVEGNE